MKTSGKELLAAPARASGVQVGHRDSGRTLTFFWKYPRRLRYCLRAAHIRTQAWI